MSSAPFVRVSCFISFKAEALVFFIQFHLYFLDICKLAPEITISIKIIQTATYTMIFISEHNLNLTSTYTKSDMLTQGLFMLLVVWDKNSILFTKSF